MYYVIRYVKHKEAGMARAGVTELDVHKAATHLMEKSINPTVDAVREILGTGSKSTIAPLLKEWKERNGSWVSEQKTGLPSGLITVVKGLYEGMQSEAAEQILEAEDRATQAAEQSAIKLKEMAQQLAKTQAELRAAQSEQEELKTHCHLLTDKLAKQSEEADKQEGTIKTLNHDLYDAKKETLHTKTLLEQSQENLEHYSESIKEQRAQERNAMDQQLSQASAAMQISQRESESLRTQVTTLQEITNKQETSLSALSMESSVLSKANKELAEEFGKTNIILMTSQKDVERSNDKIVALEKQLDQLNSDAALFKKQAQESSTLLTEANTKVEIYGEAMKKLEQKNNAQMETIFEAKQEREQLASQLKELQTKRKKE